PRPEVDKSAAVPTSQCHRRERFAFVELRHIGRAHRGVGLDMSSSVQSAKDGRITRLNWRADRTHGIREAHEARQQGFGFSAEGYSRQPLSVVDASFSLNPIDNKAL